MIVLAGLQLSFFAVHVFGLAVAWMVRTHSGRSNDGLAQTCFWALLALVALATVIGHQACLAMWPVSATTLAVMIVTATADLGSNHHSATN